MGCGNSQQSSGPLSPVESRIQAHPQVKSAGPHYVFSQSFVICRHGDRLDNTREWTKMDPEKSGRTNWPHDTPLTEAGHKRAKETGAALKQTGKKFDYIVASPYFRCAQTASAIATVLKLPIFFDLGIGEIFDGVAMKSKTSGKAEHRSPKDLEEQLKTHYTGVEWTRDADGQIKVEGSLPEFPEDYDEACMRYSFHVKRLLQTAAADLKSIVIVSHADAVSSITHMMKLSWLVHGVDFCGYLLGSRKVKVFDKNTKEILDREPVYKNPEQWTLSCSPGLQTKKVLSVNAMETQFERESMIKKLDIVQNESDRANASAAAPKDSGNKKKAGFNEEGNEVKEIEVDPMSKKVSCSDAQAFGLKKSFLQQGGVAAEEDDVLLTATLAFGGSRTQRFVDASAFDVEEPVDPATLTAEAAADETKV